MKRLHVLPRLELQGFDTRGVGGGEGGDAGAAAVVGLFGR